MVGLGVLPRGSTTRTKEATLQTKPTTLAVIADVHYGTHSSVPQRRCAIGDILLARAVRRLNHLIRPDVTLVLGDLLDDGRHPNAKAWLSDLRAILDTLDSPYIAIPGNHDGDTDAFYQVFDRPGAVENLCGVRFLPFVDQEAPGYNASRSETDVQRPSMARVDYDGPLVALQHVCLGPPARSRTPYNYTNAQEIITAMKDTGVTLSISGHHHEGAEDISDGAVTFVNAPGLCEAPFLFTVITIDGEHVSTERHALAMPEHLRLVDKHLHTQMAYCSENMDVERSIGLAGDLGLAGLTFTEHSGKLYFDKTRYWNKTCLREGMDAVNPSDNRMAAYLDLKRTYQQDGIRFGLEADFDYRGQLLVTPDDRQHFDFIVGAMHGLPSLTGMASAGDAAQQEFLSLLEKLLANEIDVLAHPFRVFRRSGLTPPEQLFQPTAELLKKHQVAAEINFHTNEPPIAFIKICLDIGVKISFGSDAHHLAEIGDFACHLALLKSAGFDGDLSEILIQDQ